MIVLPRDCAERIAGAAELAYPEECCGLLIGHRDDEGRVCITEIAESDNVAPPPRRNRFEVDPAVRFACMRRLRGTGEDIVGHFHSHPDAPPIPSAHDAAMALEPELVWLIIAVEGGKATGPAVFLYDEASGAFQAEHLIVAEDLQRP